MLATMTAPATLAPFDPTFTSPTSGAPRATTPTFPTEAPRTVPAHHIECLVGGMAATTPNRAVVRGLRRDLIERALSDACPVILTASGRGWRKRVYRHALACHAENRELAMGVIRSRR